VVVLIQQVFVDKVIQTLISLYPKLGYTLQKRKSS